MGRKKKKEENTNKKSVFIRVFGFYMLNINQYIIELNSVFN